MGPSEEFVSRIDGSFAKKKLTKLGRCNRTLLCKQLNPNGTRRPSWMYPAQIQSRSIDIQPFGATWAIIAFFMVFSGYFCPPHDPPGAILVGLSGTNIPSWMYPAQIQPRSSHLESPVPLMARLACFMALNQLSHPKHIWLTFLLFSAAYNYIRM